MSGNLVLPEGVPPLTQYYVYMTNGCNLACQHCWLSPIYQPKGTTGGHLDFDLFRIAVEEAIPLGLQNVKLTGGEPLLHPDFLRFVDLIKDKNLSLTIETNATLMTSALARYMKENSTLRHISVSVDGASKETHDSFRGVPGSFDKTITGIKMLVEAGFKPQVIMSLHNGNIDEIEDLVEMAQDWGAGSVKFNLIQPSGRAQNMAEHKKMLDVRRMVDLGRWVEYDLQRRVSINLFYSWPMAFHSLNRLLEGNGDACGILNIMGILANGCLALCGIGIEIPELTYGRLGKDRLVDIWRDNQVLRQLRSDLPAKLEGVCQSCLFKWQCLGSCVAENYHQFRRLTAPFWFCMQAQEAGVFPEKRVVSTCESAKSDGTFIDSSFAFQQ